VAYHYGKSNALALWGSGPAYGMDPNMVLAWHYYGGGKALLEEIYKSLNIDVVSFLYGPMPTQPLGWFKKPVAKVEDMKGLKFRTVGLAVDVFKEMGTAVNPLPGGEIVPALDRGLIDAAEFNNATSDRILGFPDVVKNCMLQSFHQSGEQFEILFNKGKYDALPAELKSVIDYAVQAASADMSWKAIQRNSQDYIELKKAKRQLLQDARRHPACAAGGLGQGHRAKKPREPAVQEGDGQPEGLCPACRAWQNDYMVDFKMAWNHYFRRRPRRAESAPSSHPWLPSGATAARERAGGPCSPLAARPVALVSRDTHGDAKRCCWWTGSRPGWASSSPG
jgi:hypothetical protein